MILQKCLNKLIAKKKGKEKPLIRETKHLFTFADSSTDTTVGWTENSQNPKFIEKRKKIIQNEKTQKV